MKGKFILFSKKSNPKDPNRPKRSFRDRLQALKGWNWFKISVIANLVVLALADVGLAGGAVIHQSDTNPNFCGLCHIMQPNVTSYQTSNHMDNIHFQAGVQCKDCHDYSVVAEATSGVNFLIGNYDVNKQGLLAKRKYPDSMCLECHVSYEHIAYQTNFLERNPHNNHNGQLHCSTCHVSHGDQVDYCSGCHENGGQQMIENITQPRITTSEKAGGG